MHTLWQSIKYGINELGTRRLYMVIMIFVPVLSALFFLSLLDSGLPTRVPTAVVDLDHSPMSRAMTRNLNTQQLVHITESCESYDKALDAVREGRVFGFYVIPSNFQRDALSGRTPTIDYYANMTYFVPGTFTYKGFKTVAVSTAAGLVKDMAESNGLTPRVVNAVVQPISVDIHGISNPWTNYSLYLTPSFLSALFSLMIVLTTIMSVTYQIKYGTSRLWLRKAGGSIITAVSGMLLPQTVIFVIVGFCLLSLMYGYCGFPLACPLWVMLLAMSLLVVASQAFGLFWSCVLPNPRLAMSAGALISILAFSFAGFSFPVQNMYGAISIFSYIAPVRHYFLIHMHEALNGNPIYYARMEFVALMLFPFVAGLMLWRLKKACLNPVYEP